MSAPTFLVQTAHADALSSAMESIARRVRAQAEELDWGESENLIRAGVEAIERELPDMEESLQLLIQGAELFSEVRVLGASGLENDVLVRGTRKQVGAGTALFHNAEAWAESTVRLLRTSESFLDLVVTFRPEAAELRDRIRDLQRCCSEWRRRLDRLAPGGVGRLPPALERSPWRYARRSRHQTAAATSLVIGMLLGCVIGALGASLPWVFAGFLVGHLGASGISAAAHGANP